MLQFFLDLISNKPNTPGTKRFIAIWAMLLFTVEVVVHLISKVNVQGEILLATASLITLPLGMNAAISIKDIVTKAKVANTIVEQNPASENAQDAKEVINGTE